MPCIVVRKLIVQKTELYYMLRCVMFQIHRFMSMVRMLWMMLMRCWLRWNRLVKRLLAENGKVIRVKQLPM